MYQMVLFQVESTQKLEQYLSEPHWSGMVNFISITLDDLQIREINSIMRLLDPLITFSDSDFLKLVYRTIALGMEEDGLVKASVKEFIILFRFVSYIYYIREISIVIKSIRKHIHFVIL